MYHVGTGQISMPTPRNAGKEAKDECTLGIDNQKLEPTPNLRMLGVKIDDKLSFTEHISDICKRCEQKKKKKNWGASKITKSNLKQNQTSTLSNSNSSSSNVLPNCMAFL